MKPLVIFMPVTLSISSTRLQSPPKAFCFTCGHQFTNRRFAHHQHSCQAFNSSNPNPYGHLSLISSLVPTLPASVWTWISSLDVLGSFHLNFRCPQLYNHIPITL
jgi:hypothetical protein